MSKLCKTAKTLDLFFKFTFRITIALNVIGLVSILFVLYLCWGASTLFDSLTSGLIRSLDFGGISFQIAESYPSNAGAGTVYFVSSMVIGILSLSVYSLMIRSIRGILAPMKEGLPFSREVAAEFKNLGWLTIVNGSLNLAGNYFISGSIVRAYDIQKLFLSENIERVTAYYNFSFTFLIAALILFGLSYIFHYGSELQQLSDETL